jgi:hypothetical protein
LGPKILALLNRPPSPIDNGLEILKTSHTLVAFGDLKSCALKTGYRLKCNLIKTGYRLKCNLIKTGYRLKCNLIKSGYRLKYNLITEA